MIDQCPPCAASPLPAPAELASRYVIFALIAISANIATQDIVITFHPGRFSILASVTAGTAVGLFVKYILDKRYIFRFQARNMIDDSRTFALYSLMGLVTTLIFWGFEFTFHLLFETKQMRYLGGIIGLIIGYLAKYHLDKNYVFRTTHP